MERETCGEMPSMIEHERHEFSDKFMNCLGMG